MRFSIEKKDLDQNLKVMGQAVDSNQSVPLLAGVKIKITSGVIELSTTNMEYSIISELPCLDSVDGLCCVPYRLFSKIISVLPDGLVSVDLKDNIVVITLGEIVFKVRTIADPENFPEFPKVDLDKSVTLPYVELTETIKRVAPFASKDITRPILTGVNLEVEDHKLKLAATDGYRIMIGSANLKQKIHDKFTCVIPAAFMSNLVGLDAAENDVVLGYSENQIYVECASYKFIHRRIEGQFPKFDSVIPTFEEISTVKTAPFQSALTRKAIMLTNEPLVRFKFDKGTLHFESKSDAGDAHESIKYLGQDMCNAAFNTYWFLEGLKQFDFETVNLVIKDKKSPCVVADEDESLIYIILPVIQGSVKN